MTHCDRLTMLTVALERRHFESGLSPAARRMSSSDIERRISIGRGANRDMKRLPEKLENQDDRLTIDP